jgi:hypothetical protein
VAPLRTRLYSFQRENIAADRQGFVAAGDVDGFMAAEVSSRIFGAAPHILVAVCEVRHYPDRDPHRLISVMPSTWSKEAAPAVAKAVDAVRSLAAIELLPPLVVD